MPHDPQQVARLLERVAEGQPQAADRLVPLIHEQLRALAERRARCGESGDALRPEQLIREAYERLVDDRSVLRRLRRQFLLVAARAMRRLLVEHARDALRGGDRRSAVSGLFAHPAAGGSASDADLVALDGALERLEKHDERRARLVELRMFTGLGLDDAAALLDLTQDQAREEWRLAKAWLGKKAES